MTLPANPSSLLSCTALCLATSIVFAQQAAPRKLDSADLYRAHVILRQAYDDVRKNYYDPSYHGVNLDQNFQLYDTRLNTAQSVNESFRVVAAFLDTLHDTHTFFVPPARVNHSTMGFSMEMIGDNCFIVRTRPGTDAATKLHPGDQVMGVNGFKVERASFDNMQYFLQLLSPAPAEMLDILSPTGERRQVTVQAFVQPGGKKLLDLTEGEGGGEYWHMVRQDEEEDHLNRARLYESGDVLIWKMPSFEVDPVMVDSSFAKAMKSKTLILDLRGNPGGYIETLKEALGSVFDHPVKLADRVTRKDTKPEMIKPRSKPFNGNLIVLVDSGSASCSELFARTIQLEHRGTVIGDRSAGAVMEARGFSESSGADTKTFYGFSVTSANLLMSDGKSLEHAGVVPDDVQVPTGEDLAAGKDPVLAHAAEVAGIKLDAKAAGQLFPFEWPSL